MDWNWLFSSIAQSVAALVGVAAAFVISRVMNSEAAFGARRARTRQLLLDSESLAVAVQCRRFSWYNDRTLEQGLDSVETSAHYDDELLSPSEYYSLYAFSEYVPRDEVVARIGDSIAEGLEAKNAPPNPYLLGSLGNGAVNATYATATRQRIDAEREAINAVAVEVGAHLRSLRDHIDTIQRQPEQSVALRLALVAALLLFWSGVVWPLTLLPIATTTTVAARSLVDTRSFIVGLAAILFTGLIVGLGFINERLVHPQSDITELSSWLELERYSPYLAVRQQNGFPI